MTTSFPLLSSFLAQGPTIRYLAHNFKWSRNAIRFAIRDTSCYIWKGMKAEYMPVLTTDSLLDMATGSAIPSSPGPCTTIIKSTLV